LNCLQQCNQTTQLVLDISDKSISQDLPLEELNCAVKEIQLQCSELSEKTFKKCMDIVLESIPDSLGAKETLLCDMVKDIFDETSEQCFLASDKIALDVLPIYEKIIGDCSKSSLECGMGIMGLEGRRNLIIEGLDKLQDSLIQSTVASSIEISDNILSTILSIKKRL